MSSRRSRIGAGGRRPSRAAGFTLVELLLVVAILGVAAALAAPRYGTARDRYAADLAARRVAADLLLAQARARASSATRTVTFDLATSSYTVNGMADPQRPAQPYVVRLGEAPYGARLTSADFAGTRDAAFNGYGAALRAGRVEVRCGAWTRAVKIDAGGGIVEVE